MYNICPGWQPCWSRALFQKQFKPSIASGRILSLSKVTWSSQVFRWKGVTGAMTSSSGHETSSMFSGPVGLSSTVTGNQYGTVNSPRVLSPMYLWAGVGHQYACQSLSCRPWKGGPESLFNQCYSLRKLILHFHSASAGRAGVDAPVWAAAPSGPSY